MESLRIRTLTEEDIKEIVRNAGGERAHPDSDTLKRENADFILGNAIVELKLLNEEGFEKPERQRKLAALFSDGQDERPVIVLDPETLSADQRRRYERIIEGPIKTDVAKARKQLRQSRTAFPETTASALFIVNNGYTALDHASLVRLVAHRVRQDTSTIDGVVVAGCYYYGDGFDSYFIWPIEYVPIRLENAFPAFERLREAWNVFSERFMTQVVTGELAGRLDKGAVLDMQFDVDGVTYVNPTPPMGAPSQFYIHGRPREDSTGLEKCPPVALTFPELSRFEWHLACRWGDDDEFYDCYDAWLRHRGEAVEASRPEQPFVPVPVDCEGWIAWCEAQGAAPSRRTLASYANTVFQDRVQDLIASARERTTESLVPSSYVLAVTEEIGQDRANDVSHIAVMRERPGGEPFVRPVVENLRIFHEHVVALAAAYAVAESVGAVMWQKDRRYAWV